MFEPNEIGKKPELYLYENEELIKTYTTQEYEQEGGEILIDCKCMECYMNHEKKSRHVQLETGKSYCENTGESQTLEEYISDQQNITLEESKELIKNFYSLDKFSKKIRVPVEFLERLDISLIENKIRIVNKFEKVYIINKGSLHFSKMIKNITFNIDFSININILIF